MVMPRPGKHGTEMQRPLKCCLSRGKKRFERPTGKRAQNWPDYPLVRDKFGYVTSVVAALSFDSSGSASPPSARPDVIPSLSILYRSIRRVILSARATSEE